MMMDFAGPMRDLVTVDDTDPAERVQAWRRVLMGVYTAGFGDGYSANEADASVRAALAYTPVRFEPAPHAAGEGRGKGHAADSEANGNGVPLVQNSTLTS